MKIKDRMETWHMIFWMVVGYYEGRWEQRKLNQAKDRRKYG